MSVTFWFDLCRVFKRKSKKEIWIREKALLPWKHRSVQGSLSLFQWSSRSQLSRFTSFPVSFLQKKDFPKGIPECGTDALRFALCSYKAQGKLPSLQSCNQTLRSRIPRVLHSLCWRFVQILSQERTSACLCLMCWAVDISVIRCGRRCASPSPRCMMQVYQHR